MIPGSSNHRSLRPLTMLAASGLLVWVGCSSDSLGEVGVSHPTMIEIAPESFLGDVPCTQSPGGLTRYVATLTDVTVRNENAGGAGGATVEGLDGEGDVTLASSAPVPCRAGVGFGFVVPGHQYTAVIEGYDTDAIVPRAPGSPLMVATPAQSTPHDIATAPPVAPRWRATCPEITAVSVTVVQAAGCTTLELEPDAEESDTELVFSKEALLGGLECGDEPGQVERLSISLDVGEPEPRRLELGCDADTAAVFSGLPARVSASAFVSAFSAGSTQAFAGARCEALTLGGASVTASCAKLSQVGTLRVSLADALAEAGLICSASSVTDVRVAVPGEAAPRSFPPPDCLQPFDHGFGAGSAAVTVTAFQLTQELASLTCYAEVVPGSLVTAICEQNAPE